MRSLRVVRFLLIFLVLTSIATAATEDVPAAEEPAPKATTTNEAAATEEPVEVPEVVINCNPAELMELVSEWTPDCVAQWLENLGFGELKAAFIGNKVNGTTLKTFTHKQLTEEYGVSDEDQRKKILYSLQDVVKKDNSKGNVNNYAQVLMWLLPFLALYKWLCLKYDKQIAKYTKKWRKWQEARNPKPPVEVKVYEDGTNEWIKGLNSDLKSGGKKEKKRKVAKKVD